MSHRFPTTDAGRRSGVASRRESAQSYGSIYGTCVPDVPARKRKRHETGRKGQAFPQRRAVLVKKVRRRTPHGCPRAEGEHEEPSQGVGVRTPAARKAKNAPHLRCSRKAVRELLRQGQRAKRTDRPSPACPARDAARQRYLPAQPCDLARASASARSPSALRA